MITAEELVQETTETEEKTCFKLGTVVGLFENETAMVQFDGEETPSEKQYAYLDMYIPEVEDRVLLGAIGGTYIIIGKVNYNVPPSKEEEIDRYLFDLKQVIMKQGLSVTGNTDMTGSLNVTGKITANEIEFQGNLTTEGDITVGNITAGNITSNASIRVGNTEVSGTNVKTSIVDSVTVKASSLNHAGTQLGFFGHSLTTKKSISKINVNTTLTLQVLRDKINDLMDVLDDYGLISAL